jgi:hypothetical protein
MTFQPCPQTASAVLHMTAFDGKIFESVFHFRINFPLTQAVADVVAQEIADEVTDIKGYIFSSNQWTHVTCTDLRTEGAPQLDSAVGFPVIGTSGADPLPNQNSLLMTWLTAFRGKSGRGRTYFGGFTEDAVTSGLVAPGLQTAANEMGDDFVTNPNVFFGVLSRYHDGAQRATGVLNDLTGRRLDPFFRTQRRRVP